MEANCEGANRLTVVANGGGSDADDRSVLHYELGYHQSKESAADCYRGALTFALRYDFIHRVLMVHVIKANNLPAKVLSTLSVLTILSQTRFFFSAAHHYGSIFASKNHSDNFSGDTAKEQCISLEKPLT